MDYIVEYSVNGEIKIEVVSFGDFIPSEFVDDFIMEEIEDLEKSSDIEIIHIEPLRDYNVNVYNL